MTRKKDNKYMHEVDAISPTLLFQHIQAERVDDAMARIKSNPEECKTWIVSRKKCNAPSTEKAHLSKRGTIMWKYLPLHLVCLSIQQLRRQTFMNNNVQQNKKYLKLKQLVFTIVQAYPACIVIKDFDGNLPIHIILQQANHYGADNNAKMNAGIKIDEELLNLLMDRKFKNYRAKDAFGGSIFDLLASEEYDCPQKDRNFIGNHDNSKEDSSASENLMGLHHMDLHRWIHKIEKLRQKNKNKQSRDDEYEVDNHLDQKQGNFSNSSSKKSERRDSIVSSLQLECSSKDEKIDSLSGQIEFLRSKIKSLKQHNQERTSPGRGPYWSDTSTTRDLSSNSTLQTSLSALHDIPEEGRQPFSPSYEELKAENSSLQAKIELDSSIFAIQEETIESLKHQIKVLNVEKEASEMRTEQTQKQLNQMKLELDINNDSIEHLRQITDALQKELEAKDKTITQLQSKIDESNQREQILESTLHEKDKEIERNVVTMQSDLKEQSAIIKSFIKSLDGQNIVQPSNVTSSNSGGGSKSNSGSSREQNSVSDVAKKPFSNNMSNSRTFRTIYSDDQEKEGTAGQSGRVASDEMYSKCSFDDPDVDDSSVVTNFCDDDSSHSDIRERQIRLRQDLKHIYNQIKYMMPPKASVENNKNESNSNKKEEDDNFHQQVTPKQRQRPWHQDQSTVISPRTKATAAELGAKILGRSYC